MAFRFLGIKLSFNADDPPFNPEERILKTGVLLDGFLVALCEFDRDVLNELGERHQVVGDVFDLVARLDCHRAARWRYSRDFPAPNASHQ